MRGILGEKIATAVVLVAMASPRATYSCAAATAHAAFAYSPLRAFSLRNTAPSTLLEHSRKFSHHVVSLSKTPSARSFSCGDKHLPSNFMMRKTATLAGSLTSSGRILQRPQFRMCSSSVAPVEDAILMADLVGIDGGMATLKVREDGQGTLLQGLQATFADGTTGTVIWQRTPLLFVLLDSPSQKLGKEASIKTSQNVTVPTGEELIGRVVDFRGMPLDGGAQLSSSPRRAMFGTPTLQKDMATISKPLQTGITAVDALTPIGRGQNMLIVGSLEGGRREISIDTVCNQAKEGVFCVYVSVQKDYKQTLDTLIARGAMQHTCFVACAREDGVAGAAESVAAAATGCAIAEQIRLNGKDTLVIVDDLEKHKVFWDYTERTLVQNFGVGAVAANASALNAASSEMRAFYASLFQRVGYLNKRAGGGSLSLMALLERTEPPAEQAKESYTMADFDPTLYGSKVRQRLQLMADKGITLNAAVLRKLDIPLPEVQCGSGRFQIMRIEEMMSLSDGQIMLKDEYIKKGHRPPIDFRTSLTRIGIGHDALTISSSPAMRAVATSLRFELAQASDLPTGDTKPETLKQRARALAWQAALQQDFGKPRSLSESIVGLFVASKGYVDGMLMDGDAAFIKAAEKIAQSVVHVRSTSANAMAEIDSEGVLSFKAKEAITAALDEFFGKSK